MKLSDFDYNLPKGLIAEYPLKERDQARLLVLNREKSTFEHRVFKDITEYLSKDDLLVLNDTKVLNCRLHGFRPTGGKVEILLLKHKHGSTFEALVKPAKVKLNEKFKFDGNDIYCQLTGRNEVAFSSGCVEEIYKLGVIPLPPYIKRGPQEIDKIYYQTVYAAKDGSVASPTAGLHFTKGLIVSIGNLGVNIAYVTLHVGYATFKPVKIDDITEHKMDKEYFEINDNAVGLINKTRKLGGRIFAVGTTSSRVLESYAGGNKQKDTDLFIYPGYEFKLVDCLLTNFHLPKTTLFMLVCAFAGEKFAKKAYQEAIEKKYRFYSYGDAMLII